MRAFLVFPWSYLASHWKLHCHMIKKVPTPPHRFGRPLNIPYALCEIPTEISDGDSKRI